MAPLFERAVLCLVLIQTKTLEAPYYAVSVPILLNGTEYDPYGTALMLPVSNIKLPDLEVMRPCCSLFPFDLLRVRCSIVGLP
jgi:hypothetical protein